MRSMKKAKKKSHILEVVIVLLIFAAIAVANALAGHKYTETVAGEIAQAQYAYRAEAERESIAAELAAEAKDSDMQAKDQREDANRP